MYFPFIFICSYFIVNKSYKCLQLFVCTGDDKTNHIPLNLMDDDEDCGEIQLMSHSQTSIQSPTSQSDSAFEDMVNSNQVSLSSTLEDVKDEVISEVTLEPVKVNPAENQPTEESSPKEEPARKDQVLVEFTPLTEGSSQSVHSSYVTEVPLTETRTFVKKAQQFSEIVNQPPKMTIRSTSKEMSEEHLQKVDGERRAVLSMSMVKRRGITEFATTPPTDGKIQLHSEILYIYIHLLASILC